MAAKIKKGQFPTAVEFNRHVDASDYVHARFLLGDGRPRQPAARDTSYISVKNASGADRRQGEILEFTGLELTDLTHRQAMLTGNSPTLANGFGVLQSPLASGEFAPDCQVTGVSVALVNILDADDRYARPIASTYVLQSAGIGPVRIIWKPSGTGEKTCAVHLLGVTGEILVKNDSGGNYSANGGPNTYKVMTGTPGSYTDTGQTISAYNIPAFNNGKIGAASLLEGVMYAAPWEQ